MIGAQPSLVNLFTAKENLFIGVKPLSEHLEVLTDWLALGAFKVLIHREYAMDNIVDAHESMMKDGIIGKLVVRID